MRGMLKIICPTCRTVSELPADTTLFVCSGCGQTHFFSVSAGAAFPAGGTNGGTHQPRSEGQWPLQVLSHHRYSSTNWFYVVGELLNPYELPLQRVVVTATLYDREHAVIGVTSGPTSLPVIPPGGKSPFKLGTDNWMEIHAYELQAEGQPGGMPRQDLVVTNHAHHTEGNWLQVFGEVRNLGQTPATGVRAVVTLYDRRGSVSGTAYAIAQTRIIPPGESSPFRCGINHWPDFDHYEIQVQGE